LESAKSIKRYLPPKGTDAMVRNLVISGMLLSCVFAKINPAAVISLFPLS
jgi:hypothetical protein